MSDLSVTFFVEQEQRLTGVVFLRPNKNIKELCFGNRSTLPDPWGRRDPGRDEDASEQALEDQGIIRRGPVIRTR